MIEQRPPAAPSVQPVSPTPQHGEAASGDSVRAAVPRRINIGSGKSFDASWLNIDIDPGWKPDLLVDLNEPFFVDGSARAFESERFGQFVVEPGSIDEIRAFDVLEHVRELTTAMTSCLELLRDGGRMHIVVPYELGLGAWCDPTHVRAFNERSFIYYCDWFWYLGWTEARFDTERLDVVPSTLGQQLLEQGKRLDELLRVPRAVEQLQVWLVKRPLNDVDRADLDKWRKRGDRPSD